MATKIDGCSNPEEFRCITSDVSQGIQTALDSIATEAFSKDIITSSEYQACIDGSATAENRRIKFLFTAIYEAINLDPKNLGRFLDVLKDMREPIITQNCHDPIKKMLEKDEGIDDC
ncbi:PREDICTED: uncharacterized protein LOC109587119 [Amphimedon queenslandica]|uniref:Uncharacterized protein n=2 Tax=Amphimedon queenslandica TaxID=400682 RepID=A0AAN0JPF4_AMPQE|nr:PREDICTED: uncharacterized protein LOC109587119 [Amphimedon queenslandica]|eukprot:XP_019858915.1 PREDICTED: uncharacterized protein LOC109587119 [Amphimedon queenslandica]